MENYEGAAEARLQDWEALSSGRRKVGAVHFGGIYIECLLKSIICSEHGVLDGAPGRWVVDGSVVARPRHVLTAPCYRNLLTDLYDDMPGDVMDALEYLSSPGSTDYIDYRYIPESGITDAVYEEWLEKFIKVFHYLDNKKREV